jgi:plastocyanin
MCTMLFAGMAATGISRVIAAKAAPADHVVKMENMKFSPAALRVRVGDRVDFRNADLVPHTVTAKSAGAFDSGLVKPGESWTFVAKTAGNFGYTCTFHPMMVGKLVVRQP